MVIMDVRFVATGATPWRKFARGPVVARIYNDATARARGAGGRIHYFRLVDKGRGEVRPRHPFRFLRIPFPDAVVFTTWARPALGRGIREKMLVDTRGAFLREGKLFSVQTIVEFVNRVASLATMSLIRYTPRVTGKLARSYRIEPAKKRL
jgi:hypothetical protein